MHIKKILVPLDGSWLSEQALSYADELARALGGHLHLLRARTIPMALWQDGQLAIPPDDVELEQATRYLEGHAGRLREAGLEVELACPLGESAEIILDYASQNRMDLIVMTSHGTTGIKRWLYGSVAERVVRHAPCPTLVVGLETLRHLQDRVQP